MYIIFAGIHYRDSRLLPTRNVFIKILKRYETAVNSQYSRARILVWNRNSPV